MIVTTRSHLLTIATCALLALPACRSPQRITARCPGATTCLPPLEAPDPVGTVVGESVSEDFVLRVYDVRDILDLMPVIQLVGPGETRTVPPQDALIQGLLEELDARERAVSELHGTDSGAVVVRAAPPLQEKIAAALHRSRTELVRREVGDAFPVVPPPAR